MIQEEGSTSQKKPTMLSMQTALDSDRKYTREVVCLMKLTQSLSTTLQ